MYCYIIKSLYVKDGVNLNFKKFIKSQSPARIIALGFAATIFLGSFILMLPISLNDGVNLKYVERIEGMNCITKNKQVIPISKKYKNDFIEKIVRQM